MDKQIWGIVGGQVGDGQADRYGDSCWAGWRWTSRYIGIVGGKVGDGQADILG